MQLINSANGRLTRVRNQKAKQVSLLRLVGIPLLLLLLRLRFPLVLRSNVSRFRGGPLDPRDLRKVPLIATLPSALVDRRTSTHHPGMRCAVIAVFAGSDVIIRLGNAVRLHSGRTAASRAPVLHLLLHLLLLLLLRVHVLHVLHLRLLLLLLLLMLLLLQHHHLLVPVLLTRGTHGRVRTL